MLSAHGVHVSAADSLTALRALAAIDINNRDLFQHTLRLSLLKRPEDRALFALLFDEYWCVDDFAENEADADSEEDSQQVAENLGEQAETTTEDEDIEELLARFDYDTFWADPPEQQTVDDDGDKEPHSEEDNTLNPLISDGLTHFSELRRLVRALAEHFETKMSRRLESHRHGSLLDMRRLMKKSVKFGGLPIDLAWRRQKSQRPRLVLFVDVSRSMTSHAKLLLQFTTAVLRHAWQVEVFLFATRSYHLTEKQLQDEDFDLVSVVEECGGSTRIGDNLNAFLEHYSHTLTGNRSVVIMLSDGLDGGEEDTLAQAMERIKSRTQKIVWLNPVLDLQDMEHTEREMQAALPFIDILAPAHNIECLWNLLSMLQNTSPTLSRSALGE